MPVAPATIVRTNRSWPGTSTSESRRPSGELERRVAEVDRDAARLLLGQPVGVLAGERAHEPRLAVVDVAGGADRQRHARTAAATSSTLVVRERAAVEQQPAVADDPDHGRLAAPRSGAASRSSTAQANDGSSASGSAPPPTRPTVSSTSPPTAAASRSARARTVAASSCEHAQHRDLAERALRLEVEQQRAFERGEAELVDAQRAVQRVPAQLLDQVGAPDDDPRLRAAEQLVAAEADEVGAGGERTARGRLVRELEQRAGAEVVEQRQAVPLRHRRELGDRRLLGEADDAEVRLVHAQEERGLGRDRALVVGGARAVRRPDLDEPRAGAREHVGDAEAVADLDQLAARDEHLAPLGERGEREQHRGGVVVDDERRLGAGQAAQDRAPTWSWREPRAPAARSYSRFE